MASTRRKAAAIAIAVIGVAGLSLASAATLDINSNSLGAGTEVVASCDTDGVDVGFETAYVAAAGGVDATYNATDVNVTGIDAACAGQEIRITVADGDTAVGDEIVGTLPVVALWTGTFTASLSDSGVSAPYDAELIDGVSIVIHG